jgi:hypothetical protein
MHAVVVLTEKKEENLRLVFLQDYLLMSALLLPEFRQTVEGSWFLFKPTANPGGPSRVWVVLQVFC